MVNILSYFVIGVVWVKDEGRKIYNLHGKCVAIMLYKAVLAWKCNSEVRLWIRACLGKILSCFMTGVVWVGDEKWVRRKICIFHGKCAAIMLYRAVLP